MGKKGKTTISRKEKAEILMSKWAFAILFALAIELLVYVFVLNLVPTLNRKTLTDETEIAIMSRYNASTVLDSENNISAVLSPFYHTDRYYYSNGVFVKTIDNPTWLIYYYNSVLLIASILLVMYYLMHQMEHSEGGFGKRVKAFLKKEWPFTVLLFFMLWVFISSVLAGDSYRSFVGCYNLKDGFLSFLTYGSILVVGLLMTKNREKYRKIIINTFLVTATFLAVITLWNYYYLISDKYEPVDYYYDHSSVGSTSVELARGNLITLGKTSETSAVTLGELLFGNGGMPKGKNFLIVTKRVLGEKHSGVFHNSNHYGYYLSICVIVAAVMAFKAKEWWKALLYFLAYVVMVYMAILNNTFGCYLGIGGSLFFMLIYALIPKNKNNDSSIEEEKSSSYGKELCVVLGLIIVYLVFSVSLVNENGQKIVKSNFDGIYRDAQLLLHRGSTEGSTLETNETTGEEIAASDDNSSTSEIGSGRGKLWYYGMKLALQRPFFGWGLENIIYQYSAQYNIGEGRSHNLIVQLSATTGIVGMLLYVVGISSIWIRKLKTLKTWDLYECLGMFVMVSYLISSLVGNSSFYASPYFYIFVAFVALSGKEKTK